MPPLEKQSSLLASSTSRWSSMITSSIAGARRGWSENRRRRLCHSPTCARNQRHDRSAAGPCIPRPRAARPRHRWSARGSPPTFGRRRRSRRRQLDLHVSGRCRFCNLGRRCCATSRARRCSPWLDAPAAARDVPPASRSTCSPAWASLSEYAVTHERTWSSTPKVPADRAAPRRLRRHRPSVGSAINTSLFEPPAPPVGGVCGNRGFGLTVIQGLRASPGAERIIASTPATPTRVCQVFGATDLSKDGCPVRPGRRPQPRQLKKLTGGRPRTNAFEWRRLGRLAAPRPTMRSAASAMAVIVGVHRGECHPHHDRHAASPCRSGKKRSPAALRSRAAARAKTFPNMLRALTPAASFKP